MADPSETPDAWYESFYKERVMPKACKDMEAGGCEGFFPYLAEQAPELYARITAAENELESLWLSRGEKASFRAACKAWYDLLMEAKKEFEAYKMKKRDQALLAGKQERMAM